MAVELVAGALIAGKLRLLRPLGQGGMGVVWAARHETLESDVAVKLIRPERAAVDPALVGRFEREARTMARIRHQHVVHVMDYGTVDGTVPFIVMELLAGFSLAELLERGGRLSLATARVLVAQVGGALESAHERGVVHRDIKPHNVLILEERRDHPVFVKVLDFGIAKIVGDADVPGGSHTLTETGMIVGSPSYMSPEQIQGSKLVDLRSDLWSLAVITYEILTGETPFKGSSLMAVGAAVLKGQYRPPSELRSGLPRSIDDWFAKALSIDPDARFQSATEMAEAFERAARSVDVDRSPSTALGEKADGAEPLAESRTQSHAPVAGKSARPNRRRVAMWSIAAGIGIAGAFAMSAVAGTGRVRSCPPGMKSIEGAEFQMGSPADGETPSDETPQHSVRLSAFCLDTTEVTVGAYLECKSCKPLARGVEGENLTPNAIKFWSQFCNGPDAPDHPVNCIDWQDASDYCKAVDKRLPTEAEWELAARGGRANIYPWGNAGVSATRLNACGAECSRMLTEQLEKLGRDPWPRMYAEDDSAPATAPVGHYPAGATPAGVLDLAGNVWEWTSTHFCPYGKPDCDDSRLVIRGGSWDRVESLDVRAARRVPSAPSARNWSVGFRCAKGL